jgi:glucosamine--fructose-6-phosphate aminotransferase (isomerizing)
MRDRNAQVLTVANQHESAIDDWATAISLTTDVPAWGCPVLYLPVLQLMAYYRALANGQNPDQPTNLTAVVSLDTLG